MNDSKEQTTIRNLVVVFGDQLNRDAAAFDDFDTSFDCVWMAEVEHESTHVWSHKQRIILFLSAMRHFRDRLIDDGFRVSYQQLDSGKFICQRFSERLKYDLEALKPERVIVTLPGEWRVKEELMAVCHEQRVTLDIREDRHFYTTALDFRAHVEGRKTLRMEYFYREVRKRFNVLMENEKPLGGKWNFDKENREGFGKNGPPDRCLGLNFTPDAVTREVVALVKDRF